MPLVTSREMFKDAYKASMQLEHSMLINGNNSRNS